jgi:hypothetical protein
MIIKHFVTFIEVVKDSRITNIINLPVYKI